MEGAQQKVLNFVPLEKQVGALGCQEGGVAARVGAEPEEDVEVHQVLVEGGQEGRPQADPSGRGG